MVLLSLRFVSDTQGGSAQESSTATDLGDPFICPSFNYSSALHAPEKLMSTVNTFQGLLSSLGMYKFPGGAVVAPMVVMPTLHGDRGISRVSKHCHLPT